MVHSPAPAVRGGMCALSEAPRVRLSFGRSSCAAAPGSMSADASPEGHARLIRSIARDGDRDAFAALFVYFAPRIKAYLQRTGTDAAQAEEIAQDVLLSVWRKAAQYDPSRATAAAWIFAMVRNRRIDALRRDRLAPLRIDPTDAPSPSPSAEAVLAAEQRAARLRAALDGLPREQYSVLQLAFFGERSHRDIEAALGVPLGTVKSRLRLAMAKLRAALKDEA